MTIEFMHPLCRFPLAFMFQDRPWQTTSTVLEYSQTRLEEQAWRYIENMTRPGKAR